MDITTFMVTVFCLIEDWIGSQRVRQRGPQPTVYDSEVLTLEVVGEFLGLDTDTAIYSYFRRYWSDWFPRLMRIHRTTFARQAANLWRWKEQLWQALLTQIEQEPILVVDSFPLPLARFGRAYRCQRLRAWAGWGYDDSAKQLFWGLRAHVLMAHPGVIVRLALHPADVHDRWVADDLLAGLTPAWVLGDTNYWSPTLQADLWRKGVSLLTPRKSSRKRARHPWPRWLTHARRRIETVASQLVERWHAKRVWARDPWHLCSRWLRKILSHTFVVFLGQQFGLASPLRFADLITL